MTTKLRLYNGALLHLGERRLTALTDETESRRALDDVWDDDAYIDFLLEQGAWNWAIRSVELTYSPSITPSFGFQHAFDRPTDWIRTVAVSASEYFIGFPLNYLDESDYLWADEDTIYVRYVSNDSEYGGNLAAWPASFVEWVKAHLAYRVAVRVTGSSNVRDAMYKLQARMLTEARSRDAMNDAVSYPPSGTWAPSRRGRRGGDRGSRGQLIG